MKTFFKILLFVVIVLVAAAFARNLLIRKAAEKIIERSVDFEVRLEQVHVGLFSPDIEILGIEILNPEDFGGEEALRVDRVYVQYAPLSLLSDVIRIPKVELDLPKALVVRTRTGETNIEALADGFETKAERREIAVRRTDGDGAPGERAEPRESAREPVKPRRQRRVHIDEMTLKLGKVEVRDYQTGGLEPRVFTYELNLDRTYRDIASMDDLVQRISGEILARVSGNLMAEFMRQLEQSDGDYEEAAKQLEKNFKQLFQSTETP